MVRWIVGIGVLMAVGAIVYLAATGELYFHLVVATLMGVFFSVLLGCGLFALSFFSDKSWSWSWSGVMVLRSESLWVDCMAALLTRRCAG